jgi:hypothetical protein
MSEKQRISFEVRYVFALKDGIPQDQMEEHLKNCANPINAEGNERPDECLICKKLLSLDRYWTRREIETLSQKFGYSVFDNPGGRVNSEGGPSCIFTWKNKVVIRK